jgi:excisionase family DNA binding protein
MGGLTRLLTSAEVGELLGIHAKTVERMCRRGELPGIRVGRYWRFRAADIEKYVDKLVEARLVSRLPVVPASPFSISAR